MVKIVVIGILAIMGAGYLVWRAQQNRGSSHVITIGIVQTASHPALDAAREGLKHVLLRELKGKVAFVEQNAQGMVMTAQAIAQSMHARSDVNAIVAIATPAAQAVAAVEKEKPIIIAAVSDPQTAGLLENNTNVCGASDMVDVAQVVQLLRDLAPAANTIALLYCSSEVNSVVQVKQMKAALVAAGLTPVEMGVTSEAEVQAAIMSACRHADAILVPTDNVIASSMPMAASIALEQRKPLIAAYDKAVEQGALAARGVNYTKNGEQAAACVLQVLGAGKKPADLPIVQQEGNIVINKRVLDALGLVVPEALRSQVTMIEGSMK